MTANDMKMDEVVLTARERDRDPADVLGDLILSRAGVSIPTSDVDRIFRDDWAKLSTLAHRIHAKHKGASNGG